MNTFNIKMTSEQAAKFLRSQLGDSGKDVLAHMIEIMGHNRPELLDLTFQSIAPDYNPVGDFKVGDSFEMIQYGDITTATITEINLAKTDPIYIKGFRWTNLKDLNSAIEKAKKEREKAEQEAYEG